MPNRQLTLPLMLGVALFTAGCGNDTSQADECTSALQIDLLVDNVAIDVEDLELGIEEVLYTISGNGLDPDITGTIDTSDPNTTVSIALELPAGEGYLIVLEARSKDGKTICRGHETFDVTTGTHTEVHVYLNCSSGRRFGAILADGWYNICAELTYRVVSPLETSVGKPIIVTSAAQDDDDKGSEIEYRWTSTFMRGSFEDPSARSTFYTCEQEGADEITLTVSDDHFDYCKDIWSVPITCGDETGSGGGGGSGTGGIGGDSGTGGVGGDSGTGGVGGDSGTGGTGNGSGTGGTGNGSGTGGTGNGSGTGGTGNGSGTGGTGNGSGTGGTGNGSGTGGTGASDGNPECLVSLSVN